jgi:ATP-dependent DNA helicase RecQ
LHAAFRVRPELREKVESLTGPVLLVDDVVDSGWTMALVGRLLRQAGAPGVLPFALALVS